ncbi:MAG: sulfatase-like hydrolase/transferase [Candidatus Marinimicrobia bacterium]|nr:sulfatase-like hydrolase/transferase [Candidatus Neomarinimicrobiota bacterium]
MVYSKTKDIVKNIYNRSLIYTRRNFLKTAGLGSAALALQSFIPRLSNYRKQPNILFIMSDDHAANAISCYGSHLAGSVSTPNIDRIAEKGIRLNRAFCTNSICTPSRASILTGKYGHHNGVFTLDDNFDRNQPNVAKHLQKAGYETAIIGKWHLHTEPSGFDYYNVLPNQGLYFDPYLKESGKEWKDRKEGGEVSRGYVTDIITDKSIDWLKNRRSDKPFFLMCHHKAPHGLWEYPPRNEHLFDNVDIPEPPSMWEDKTHRSIGSREHGSNIRKLADRMSKFGKRGKEWPTGKLETSGMDETEVTKAAYQKYMKDYLRCAAAIDENVGRLLDYLDQTGLTDNTVIIYTSDQGQFLGEHDYYDKRWFYEESLRMPLLIQYPSEIKPGSEANDIIINTDFAPTFLDFAGISTPQDMQGSSFRKILEGYTSRKWRKSMYYRYWMHMAHHNIPAHYGIRTERYKLIFFYGLALGKVGKKTSKTLDNEGPDLDLFKPTKPGWELYDLKNDPQELRNVYDDPDYKGIIEKLKVQLLHAKEELDDTDEKYPELMQVRQLYWDT